MIRSAMTKRPRDNRRARKQEKSPSASDQSTAPIQPEKHWPRWLDVSLLSLASILIVGLYAPSLGGDFAFDDHNNITDNVHIRLTTLDVAGIREAALESPHPRRFVVYVSFALNYYLHQYDVAGYRAVNIAIHIITAILVYLFVLTTLGTPAVRSALSARREIALFAAVLWVVHPIAPQSVTYVVQRMNSLSGMSRALLKLSGSLVHDYATISDDSPSPNRASRARRAATSAGIS